MEDRIEVNGIKYIKADSIQPFKSGPLVLVRTYSAGVMIGEYDAAEWKHDKQVIILKNARYLWRWRGANTLNEVALHGVNRTEYTRISEPIAEKSLVPIEIIPIADGLDFKEVWND
jgi:hypothetical protein